MTAAHRATSLYDRLGGEPTVRRVVDGLFSRARSDDELVGYFHATDMDVQRQKLVEMIGEALGGPTAPWLLGLREAHAGRNITHRHFSLMAAHLVDILSELGVGADETDTIMQWFASGRAAVVDEPTC
jgi:hemoglobin